MTDTILTNNARPYCMIRADSRVEIPHDDELVTCRYAADNFIKLLIEGFFVLILVYHGGV